MTFIEMFMLLATLIVVPLGVRAVLDAGSLVERVVRRFVPFAALLAAASFVPGTGAPAALMASAWLLLTIGVGLAGLGRLYELGRRRESTSAHRLCRLAALLYLPVGGISLVLSRAGAQPMGYQEPIVILTAIHFHFAAFAAPIIASWVGRTLESLASPLRRIFPVAAVLVILGPGVLAAAWGLRIAALKVAGSSLLVLGHALVAALALAALRGIPSGAPRWLLMTASASILFAMSLAAVYAVGEYTGDGWIGIGRMALYHGIANGIGFSFCGLLGVNLAARRARAARKEEDAA